MQVRRFIICEFADQQRASKLAWTRYQRMVGQVGGHHPPAVTRARSFAASPSRSPGQQQFITQGLVATLCVSSSPLSPGGSTVAREPFASTAASNIVSLATDQNNHSRALPRPSWMPALNAPIGGSGAIGTSSVVPFRD